MYYAYILESLKDRKLYVGYTNNLKKRFEEHNSGKIPVTKNRGPFREKYFKTGWGRTHLKKVLKNYWKSMSP